MNYTTGDVVLVRFPYTDLNTSKIRPVLIIKDANKFDDVICFQVSSKKHQPNIAPITKKDFINSDLKLISFVRYDKCYTLNAKKLGKTIAKVNPLFLQKIKQLFCDAIL